jgi:trehalose 6-phosphate phosphatase
MAALANEGLPVSQPADAPSPRGASGRRMVSAPPPSLNLDEFAILLDVDGTILDLAPTPAEVVASPNLRRTLARLTRRTGGALALVSGRSVSDLDLIFAPLQLPAVGGHGAELRPLAEGEAQKSRAGPLDAELKRRFATIAAAGPGILVEDKGYSIALHYRLAPDKELLVREAVAEICAQLDDKALEILPGKAVIEIKPAGFDKGTGVRALMACRPFAGRRALFIGDDTTDEAAFAVLDEFAGVGFSVGRVIPGTAGHFDAPRDVRRWLEQISKSDDPTRS